MLKRLFDIMASFFGLIVLILVFALIAVAIKLNSPGPVLYRARRVGRWGNEFKLYKFRTMVSNADRIGPGITLAKDRRITFVGRILRRSKLDELPQLVNVLKGEMSLVGPRPEDPRYVALYTYEQRKVLNVRPGITSMASLLYSDEETTLSTADWEDYYIRVVMPTKLNIDLEYVKKATLWTDIKLIIKTIFWLLWANLLFAYRRFVPRWPRQRVPDHRPDPT